MRLPYAAELAYARVVPSQEGQDETLWHVISIQIPMRGAMADALLSGVPCRVLLPSFAVRNLGIVWALMPLSL